MLGKEGILDREAHRCEGEHVWEFYVPLTVRGEDLRSEKLGISQENL